MTPGSPPPESPPSAPATPSAAGKLPAWWHEPVAYQSRARRLRRLWWVPAGLAALIAVVAVPAAVLSSNSGSTPSDRAMEHPIPTATSESQAEGWINNALRRQDAALVAGNESAWLAEVDPGHPDLVAQYRWWFESLRGLSVSEWKSGAGPAVRDGQYWSTKVSVSLCLGAPSCQAAGGPGLGDPTEHLKLALRWRLGNGKALLASENGSDPQPWMTAPLVFATGARTIVAAPASLQASLAPTLAAAERAAANADTFNPGRHPAKYLVYLAGRTEWTQWYGQRVPTWAIGLTVHVSAGESIVVIDVPEVPPGDLESSLRHELGHVVTATATSDTTWWVTEGVADYVDSWTTPVSQYARLADVRHYLRTYHRTALDTKGPGNDEAAVLVSGDYGIACLAIRYLAEKYGHAEVLSFVDDVEDHFEVEGISQRHFGADWPTVQKAIFTYIHHVAGV